MVSQWVAQPRSQGPLSSYHEKVPWLRLVTCLCIQNKSAPGVGMEEKVALPHRRYFES